MSRGPRQLWIATAALVLATTAAISAAANNAFLNLSARGNVQGGENVLIGGLAVETRSNVLIRGIGPSLGSLGVSNPLPHPKLTLVDNNGTIVATDAPLDSRIFSDLSTVLLRRTRRCLVESRAAGYGQRVDAR